jgi:hypothetical protein
MDGLSAHVQGTAQLAIWRVVNRFDQHAAHAADCASDGNTVRGMAAFMGRSPIVPLVLEVGSFCVILLALRSGLCCA